MKIRTKMSLIFLITGILFIIAFLVFVDISGEIDVIRNERQKCDSLLIQWNELSYLTSELIISETAAYKFVQAELILADNRS